jgi:hypothetical protein
VRATAAWASILLGLACGDDGGAASSMGTESASSSSGPPSSSSAVDTTASTGHAESSSGAVSLDDTSSTAAGSGTDEAGGSSTGDAPLPACPTYGEGVQAGTLQAPIINEASGLVFSRTQPGVLWVHNDSGDSARVFAIDLAGALLGEFTLEGAGANDWEDMAIGPAPEGDGDVLYLGDIGDNAEQRASVRIFRVAEPEVPAQPAIVSVPGVVELEVAYPDEPHNAETLLVDPVLGDLYIVTKEPPDTSLVFRIDPTGGPGTLQAQLVGELGFGTPALPGSAATTAGDVSSDGSLVAIRSYNSAYAWRRPAGGTLVEAFDTEPCELPLSPRNQGETFAFDPTADTYVTVSEGAGSPLWQFTRTR